MLQELLKKITMTVTRVENIENVILNLNFGAFIN